MASRSIICRSRRLRQIIDLRDISFVVNFSSFSLETTTWPANNYLQIMVCSCTVLSTEFNNCFIIQSPSKFFFINIFGKLPFSRKSDRKREKSVRSFTHEQNIICSQTLSQTQVDDVAHKQTIICRQLLAGHVVGSRPIKRKKKLHRMITSIRK